MDPNVAEWPHFRTRLAWVLRIDDADGPVQASLRRTAIRSSYSPPRDARLARRSRTVARNEDAQLAGGQAQLANFDPDHRGTNQAAKPTTDAAHTVVAAICMHATVAFDFD
jgi:hypothetical protein